MADIKTSLEKVKSASRAVASAGAEKRTAALRAIAALLEERRQEIKKANDTDVSLAKDAGLRQAMIDRLRLGDAEIDSMIRAVREITAQEDPVGLTEGGTLRPNGLRIIKVRVPLGVVAVIYESRPNVTIDSAALCLKSGNAAVLRGGKEALRSNAVLARIVKDALESADLPRDAVLFVEDSDRSLIADIASARGLVDVIIPRGGSALINYVNDNAKVPVVMHDKGVCHAYIDKSAKIDMAASIVFNAKAQKPSACNALETLLVHRDIAPAVLPPINEMLKDVDADLRGDEEALKYIDGRPAIEEDWQSEYGAMILSVKVVSGLDEAMDHIARYGSGHSEAIVTEDYSAARKFAETVDAAAVYVNASTRFTDGGEFGLGAEIGISTQKLHVRGPMGAKDLTTTKYTVYGSGQLRS